LDPASKHQNLILNTLAEAYFMRSMSYMEKGTEAKEQGNKDKLEKYSKQAYLDASSVLRITPSGDDADYEKKVIAIISGAFPEFANLPPQEEPSVQQFMQELSKSPAASMPKVVTVSDKVKGIEQNSAASPRSAPSEEKLDKPTPEQAESAAVDSMQMYFKGNDLLSKDREEGIKLIRKSAELGCIQAQEHLFKYKLVEANERIKWGKKLAEDGNATAMYNLGVYHRAGLEGFPADKDEAIKWFTLAADKGVPNAKNELKKLKKKKGLFGFFG
jgi:hypothetical protein